MREAGDGAAIVGQVEAGSRLVRDGDGFQGVRPGVGSGDMGVSVPEAEVRGSEGEGDILGRAEVEIRVSHFRGVIGAGDGDGHGGRVSIAVVKQQIADFLGHLLVGLQGVDIEPVPIVVATTPKVGAITGCIVEGAIGADVEAAPVERDQGAVGFLDAGTHFERPVIPAVHRVG